MLKIEVDKNIGWDAENDEAVEEPRVISPVPGQIISVGGRRHIIDQVRTSLEANHESPMYRRQLDFCIKIIYRRGDHVDELYMSLPIESSNMTVYMGGEDLNLRGDWSSLAENNERDYLSITKGLMVGDLVKYGKTDKNNINEKTIHSFFSGSSELYARLKSPNSTSKNPKLVECRVSELKFVSRPETAESGQEEGDDGVE